MKIDNLNMKKEKRYWLRGGLIGLVVGIVATIAIIPLTYSAEGSDQIPAWLDAFFYMSMWLADFTDKLLPYFMDGAVVVLIPITYFLYGAIIGWIYGKMKNRGEK